MGAARTGDGAALEALLRRHVDRIHGVCRRMTGNDADADDATQEALIAVVRGIDRFDGRASFATWAYRVATNACLDELRRRRRRPVLAGSEVADVLSSHQAGSPDAAERVAARIDLDAALSQLVPEQRAAVVLRDLCQLDYAEIAEILGIPPGTVRSRIARGRGRLADLMAGGNPPPDVERRNR